MGWNDILEAVSLLVSKIDWKRMLNDFVQGGLITYRQLLEISLNEQVTPAHVFVICTVMAVVMIPNLPEFLSRAWPPWYGWPFGPRPQVVDLNPLHWDHRVYEGMFDLTLDISDMVELFHLHNQLCIISSHYI
jgi:hypothetical protein